jgi:phosphatidylserine/phosphatidylglycerophosphate/cardiolipin synthase-like enzyme
VISVVSEEATELVHSVRVTAQDGAFGIAEELSWGLRWIWRMTVAGYGVFGARVLAEHLNLRAFATWACKQRWRRNEWPTPFAHADRIKPDLADVPGGNYWQDLARSLRKKEPRLRDRGATVTALALAAPTVSRDGALPHGTSARSASADSRWKGPRYAEWKGSLRHALDGEDPIATEGITVTDCPPAFKDWPVLKPLFHPEIRITMLDLCDRATESLYLLGYTFDMLVLVWRLVDARKRGVTVIVVLDKGQMLTGASKRQKEAIKNLLANDVLVYMSKPPQGGGFTAVQHAKVLVADEAVAILGSANFTHNSMEWCTEANVTTRGKEVVDGLMTQFRERRDAAEELMMPRLEELIRHETNKKQEAAEGRAQTKAERKAASQKAVRIEPAALVQGVPLKKEKGTALRRSGSSRDGIVPHGMDAGSVVGKEPAKQSGHPVARAKVSQTASQLLKLYNAERLKIEEDKHSKELRLVAEEQLKVDEAYDREHGGAAPEGASSKSSRCISSLNSEKPRTTKPYRHEAWGPPPPS